MKRGWPYALVAVIIVIGGAAVGWVLWELRQALHEAFGL